MTFLLSCAVLIAWSRFGWNGRVMASNPMTIVQTGHYRHYKGKEYTVIGVALHSETQEELIVYRQEYGDHGLWVRPKQMFLETVTVDGQTVPRFQYLGGQA